MLDAKQVTIVGVGLLGASLGLSLRRAGFAGRLIGVGRGSAGGQVSLDIAIQRGAIDQGVTDLADAVPGSDLVILGTPLGTFESLFKQLATLDHPQLVITDLGSTKANVQALAEKYLPEPRRFVGSHPMAGSEQQGPAAAQADLFDGNKPCIITPTSDCDAHALAMVRSLWDCVGMPILTMTPDDHDQQVAAISHLPHAMAVMLVHMAQQFGAWDVASTGFRDTTRLASSNPPMRLDIMHANRQALARALDAMAHEIDTLSAKLSDEDSTALLAYLETAKTKRESWLEPDSK